MLKQNENNLFRDRQETVRGLWFLWCEDLTCDWLQHNKRSRHILGVHGNTCIISAVNSLVYHRNIFRSSLKVFGNLRTLSEIFGNSWKMFRNICLAFGTIFKNLWKSLESGQKSSENHQKRRHQYVNIMKRTLHVRSKI